MTTRPAPISVQLYSLREAAAVDFVGVLERLGAIGFTGVELAGFHGLTPKELARTALRSGLVVSSGHIGDAATATLEASLDDLQAAGCDVAVVGFLPPAAFADLDAVQRSADRVTAAYEAAAKRGMTLGYHNHWWEFETIIDGRPAWQHLFERVPAEVFAELDVYWATVGGADPQQLLADHPERIRMLHLKDGPATDPKAAMVAVGGGAIDIAGIVHAGPTVAWHVVELDRCDTDMFVAIESSYEYLVSNRLSAGRR
jgi:sugar phosphate isomerase/epimerase